MQKQHLRLAAAASLLYAAAGCGMSQLPAAPPARELEIRGTTLLMPGGRGRLTAWQAGGGELREVRATWTVEGDAVSVTSGGVVAARALGPAIVRARYDDFSGVTTVHVVDSVAGTWRGSIAVVDCWQSEPTSPDPCSGRVGLTAPLVLRVTQSASADLNDNLRAAVDVFTPPASGSFVGAVDSSGLFFLDGYIERGLDGLRGAVNLRWQRDGDRLVPWTLNARGDDRIDVGLSVRAGGVHTPFVESWQLSPMTR